jgi:hypothetical protein
MTAFPHADSNSRTRTRRLRATIIACALAAFFTFGAAAEAAVIKFEFETTTPTGDPFGQGWFKFDDVLFPFPYHVERNPPSYPDVFVDFYYSDPIVGVFREPEVATAHFEPAFLMWSFVIATPDNLISLIGQAGSAAKSESPTAFQVLNVSLPRQVPEPGALLLIAGAVSGFLARRRLVRP